MAQELIDMVERDLRQVVEAEFMKFRERYSECVKVDSIYLNEHVAIGVYDIQIHSLICSHHLNIFIAGDRLHEFPEFNCYVRYEDKDTDFKRDLGHIVLLYTPTNKCYVKFEFHEYELREVAEHIMKTAAALAAAEEGSTNEEN
jgi:hypothetical protein